jgi:hypothetical protein
MGYVPDSVLDLSLTEIKTSTRLLLCSSQPADYAAAVAAQLAHKDAPTLGAIGDYAGGRRFAVSAITDGVGDATGTATYYALVRVADTTLLATEALATPFDVASGGTVELDAFNVSQPDAQ